MKNPFPVGEGDRGGGWLKWVFVGWLLTQAFYLGWWMRYDYVFGKSDVDNYLYRIPEQELRGVDLRHILIQQWQRLAPAWAFVFLIPAIYWWGTAYPVLRLFGRDGLFAYALGSASMGLFFVIALWSQFISLSLMLWALLLLKDGRRSRDIAALALALLSLTYLPMLYFWVALYAPMSWLVAATAAAMVLIPQYFWWTTQHIDWNPAWVWLLYLCPILTWKLMFRGRWDEGQTGRAFILILTRLSRGIIFLFPWCGAPLSKKERLLTVGWWLFTMVLFAIMFWQEATCQELVDGVHCRIWTGMMP